MKRLTQLLAIVLLVLPAAAQNEGEAIDQRNRATSRAAVRDRAVRVIVTLSQDRNAVYRANAIEAMHPMPDRALPLAQRGLADENPAVRFAAVVTAGMLQFDSLRTAIRPLLRDADPSVRAAALYSLHGLGDEVNLTPLAGLLRSKDPAVRANVAMLLGLMGDKSAAPMLKQAAGAPMPRAGAARDAVVRCQFAEAIVKLGDDSELDTLRASAYNTFGEVRVIAINALGTVGDERMIPALQQFVHKRQAPAGTEGAEGASGQAEAAEPAEPVEVRLAAAAALARMGRFTGLRQVLALSEHPSPVVRSQAAWALGWFADEASFKRLAAMLDDETPIIRIAAAASVVRRVDAAKGRR